MSNPIITLSAGTTPVIEGANSTYIITLCNPATIPLTVNFNTLGSTAASGDYTLTAGIGITSLTASSFTIEVGVTSAILSLHANTDSTTPEPNETVVVNLTAGAGYNLASTNANVDFSPRVDYATGPGPFSVCANDFNSDGRVDLATINNLNGTVSVLSRNDSNSGFNANVDYHPTSSVGYFVRSGDFDGDGKPDLVIANGYANGYFVATVLNNTGTSFTTSTYPISQQSTNSYSVETGDFNDDGKLDFAVTNWSGQTVSVFLNNGSNNFSRVDVTAATGPRSICVADFNGDGNDDFAVDRPNSSVTVFYSNGSGSFAATDYATGSNPLSVSAGDFNGDGKVDLAVANYNDRTISVLLRAANNSGFLTQDVFPTSTGEIPSAIHVGDFNNDCRDDLAVINYTNNSSTQTVSVLLRNAANTGFDYTSTYTIPSGNPSDINVGDFNGDGKLDFVVSNANANTVSVWLNTSTTSTTLTIADVECLVLTSPDIIQYTDSIFDDDFTSVSGVLNATPFAGITYGIYGGNVSGTTVTQSSAYGELIVNSTTGGYTFIPNDPKIEELASAATCSFIVTASAGSLVDSQTLTINITQQGITDSIGSDLLLGTAGNDKFDGLAGNDTIAGRAGNDTIKGGMGIDNLYGEAGNDQLFGDAQNDKLWGGAGDDRLFGGENNDKLFGEANNDQLFGNEGNDILDGGLSNDTLIGGLGKDFLTGGAGADIFKFISANETGITSATRDTISDFTTGIDKIDLSAIDCFSYIGNSPFSAAGQIRYVGGILSGNTDANLATTEFSIALTGVPPLSLADFV
jgi:Ca2+-binding RTX toxin-like protein